MYQTMEPRKIREKKNDNIKHHLAINAKKKQCFFSPTVGLYMKIIQIKCFEINNHWRQPIFHHVIKFVRFLYDDDTHKYNLPQADKKENLTELKLYLMRNDKVDKIKKNLSGNTLTNLGVCIFRYLYPMTHSTLQDIWETYTLLF